MNQKYGRTESGREGENKEIVKQGGAVAQGENKKDTGSRMEKCGRPISLRATASSGESL